MDLSSSSSLLELKSKSIMCERCGRCRCIECTSPRLLPSRSICGDHCELSSRSIVDALSCMCCVKACLYHGSGHVYDDSQVNDFYEDGVVCDCDHSCTSLRQGICGSHSLWSCSSKSTDRCFRWTILGSAMTCLPCLWFYLPLKFCASIYETAYVKYYDNGCRCGRRDAGESSDTTTTFRKRNRRSRTLPPELPSMATRPIKKSVVPGDFKSINKKTSRRYSLKGDEER